MKLKIDYHTNWGENIAIKSDATDELITLSCEDGHTWLGEAELPEGSHYRYCLVKDGKIERIECGCLPHTVGKDNSDDLWMLPQRVAGIAVPVFSLRTKGSQGVGDFGDLKLFIDWADRMGLKAIQILPINDTTTSGTWKDSYPYNSISAFALHPMYVDLRQIACLGDKQKSAEELNNLSQIDYEAVNIFKRQSIIAAYTKEWSKVKSTEAYKTWYANNEYWLLPYAKFRVMQNVYEFEDGKYDESLYFYTQFILHTQLKSAADYARSKGIILKGDIPIGVSRDGVDVANNPELFHEDQSTGAPPDFFSDDGQNWGFPTYNWQKMSEDGYLWWKRRMKNLEQYFSAYRIDHLLGFFRIWSIPVRYKSGLNGEFQPALPMSKDEISGYGLNVSEEIFRALFLPDYNNNNLFHPRINGQKTKEYLALDDGQKHAFDNIHYQFFYERHNQFWYDEAMKKLPVLTATNLMICCGEDLGMVPSCVPWVMKQLNILSLEVQNMPKEFGVEFGNPAKYPELSVCTISSHDTQTFRGWWKEEPEAAQRYYNTVLQLQGEAPAEAPGWICERVICNHLASPSALCILTLQDWLGIDETLRLPESTAERINIPANPRHYWRWRMHLNIEDLIESEGFNNHVRQLVFAYGRSN